MKWQITFKQPQHNCCPPGRYWIVRKTVIEAATEQEAEAELLNRWKYNQAIIIKRIEKVSHD